VALGAVGLLTTLLSVSWSDPMARMNPTRILGRWHSGFALDYHSISSEFVGHDEYGHPMFETKRSELGELLYRLKYGRDLGVVEEIGATAAEFLRTWKPGAEFILPVPPSRPRLQQPVLLIAERIGRILDLEVHPEAVTKLKAIPQLKDVFEYDKRVSLLQGAHSVARSMTEGRNILLFDDLFRSGATMNSIAQVLSEEGSALDVYAMTITRTRSKA
jgi:competence protein ComFC